MASGSFTGGNYGGGALRLRVDWSSTQNIAANQSTITADLWLIFNASGYYVNNLVSYATVTIGGQAGSLSVPAGTRNGSFKIGTVVRTVTHKDDGTLTVNIHAAYDLKIYMNQAYVGTMTASADVAMDRIARVSEPSVASSFNIGNNLVVNTNRKSSAITHTVKFTLGSWTVTQNSVGDSATLTGTTYAAALFQQLPNANSGQMRIDVTSYAAGVNIGTRTIYTNALVTGSVPTMGTIKDVRDINATTKAITGNERVFIVGYSKMQIDINTATFKNYATLVNYIYKQGSSSVTTTALMSNTIVPSNTGPVTVSVVDSRGLTASTSFQPTILPYDPVSITSITLTRKNGIEREVYLTLRGRVSLLTLSGVNKNYVTKLSWRYKNASSSTWITGGNITYSTASDGTVLVNNFSLGTIFTEDTPFNIEVTIGDRLLTASRIGDVTRGTPLLSKRSTGIGIKKVPDPAVSLDVAGRIRSDSMISTTDKVVASVSVETNKVTSNGYYKKFSDGIVRKVEGGYTYYHNSSYWFVMYDDGRLELFGRRYVSSKLPMTNAWGTGLYASNSVLGNKYSDLWGPNVPKFIRAPFHQISGYPLGLNAWPMMIPVASNDTLPQVQFIRGTPATAPDGYVIEIYVYGFWK